MFKPVLFWCLVFAIFPSLCETAAIAQDAGKSPEKLTVMTWNLEWFYDELTGDNFSKLAQEKSAPDRAAWAWHRDAIADRIHKVRPTILAMQEVESRRALWYLTRSLDRDHKLEYQELCIQGNDHFTEQDVGMLFRAPADVLSTTQFAYPNRLRDEGRFYDVTKHLMAVFEFPAGNSTERVMVMNVHFRSKAEGEPIRLRQARLAHQWIRSAIKNGENVILLGDTNTEEKGDTTRQESDIGIACGLETPDPNDDLIDLHLRLPPNQRQTHLLPGRQFDRIMVSRSLLEDDPSKPDLVFESIAVRRDLAIQAGVDTPEEHWEDYWRLPADERDLSDHYPVVATFEVR